MIQSDRYLSDKERRAIDFPLELNAASAAEYTALKAQHPDTLVGFEAGGKSVRKQKNVTLSRLRNFYL